MGAISPKEIYLNVKKPFFTVLFALAAGLVLGLILGAFGTRFFPGQPGSGELKYRLEQVNRDLNTAIDSQREAAERAAKLQTELNFLTEHARNLEVGIRRLEAGIGSAETRTGNLAVQLEGIIDESGELANGINRAFGSLEESRDLLDELGAVLRGLP